MAALSSTCKWLLRMYVEVLQGYVSPERLAHMWSVVHLGVRSRCLRLHVEGAVHVGAQQEKVDRCRVVCSVCLCKTSTARRFRQACRSLAVLHEPMHCVTPSLCQSLLVAIPPGACASMAQRCVKICTCAVLACEAVYGAIASWCLCKRRIVVCFVGPHWQTL